MNQYLMNITKQWPYLLGMIVGLYFIVLNVTGLDFAYFPGDLGDGRFNMYILEHAHQYFSGNIDSYWDAPFMYPEKEVITYSDNLLGTAPIYSFFRLLGANVISAFQYWFVLIAIFNYSSCYLLLNWLFKNRYAAVLGAFVFAFSIALQSQMTHAQTFPRLFIPLAIWMGLLFMQQLKPIYFFLTLLFVSLQFYSGIYLGFLLVIPLIFLFLTIIIKKRKELLIKLKNIKWSLIILISIILNAFFLSILMTPYYERSLMMGENDFSFVVETIPHFKSFIFTQPGTFTWNFLTLIGTDIKASWDHHLFPGGIALLSFILLIIILIFNKKLKVNIDSISTNFKIIAITGILTVFFVIQIDKNSLYWLLYHLPGFGSMRSITRIINIDLLFFGLAVSFITYLIIRKYTKFTIPIFLLLLTLLTVDNYLIEGASYRTEKAWAQQRIDKLTNKMKDIPKGSIVSYETSSDEEPKYWYQLDAMLAAQSLGLKTVNAYTATSPGGYHSFWDNLSEEARIHWFESNNFKPKKVYVIH